MKSCAVAIVGHVDHGKTALVGALTGQDTDRLAEEKVRGLSITLGFAHRAYESGLVDFIDSPGHEDFIRAMVCGSTGAQAALVVISAVEGVARQTREHLQILKHLGIDCGVVAVTKIDMVPEADRNHVRAQIKQSLGSSPFAEEPFIFCSSKTGEGVDALHLEIEELVHRAPQATRLAGSFLPIDRVFTLKGVGTVATGTLLGAPMTVGDEVVVQPGETRVTIRRLQSRGADVSIAQPGSRTAVNLRGLGVEDLHRGDVVCAPNTLEPSAEIDAVIEIDPEQSGLKHGDDVRLMMGTGSHIGKVILLEDRRGISNGKGFARFRLQQPVAVHAKQKGVLRRLSPAETLGGFRVIDPTPPHSRRKDALRLSVLEAAETGDLVEIALALCASGKGVASLSAINRLAGSTSVNSAEFEGFEAIEANFVSPSRMVEDAKSAFKSALSEALSESDANASLPALEINRTLANRFAEPLLDHVARSLLSGGELSGSLNALALPDRDPFAALSKPRRQKIATIERALRDGGLTPPDLAELEGDRGRDADLVKLLVSAGRAKFLSSTSQKHKPLLHMDALDTAYEDLKRRFPPPREFTTSEAREVLNTTRKYAIPVLEHFDKLGLTHRNGNVRRIVSRGV